MQVETHVIGVSANQLRLVGKTTVDSSLDDLFKQLFYAPSITDQLGILTQRSEADVVQIRQKANGEEAIAWRIKMCCDVSLVNRNYAQRGRGNVDIFGQGVKAAVKRRAQELGCGTSTIWLNLRIFKTFFQNSLPENNILEDKGFFKAALRAPSPHTAIRVFVRLKQKSGAQFKVSDAVQWASKKRLQQKQLATYGRIKKQALIPYLQRDLAKLTEMKRAFPDQRLAHRLYGPMVEALNDQLTDILEATATTRLREICEAQPETVFSINQLSEQTGLAVGNIRYYMNQLENDRIVYQTNDTVSSWRCPQRVQQHSLKGGQRGF